MGYWLKKKKKIIWNIILIYAQTIDFVYENNRLSKTIATKLTTFWTTICID